MTPDDLYHQLDMDDSTLEGLAKHGDDPSQSHAVEHHFIAPSPEPLRNLEALGPKLGLTPSAIQDNEWEGKVYFSIDLVSATALSPASVYRESLLMNFLGESFAATYDGWGTLVRKK